MDLIKETKMRSSGEWIDSKSARVVEDYTNKMIEMHGDDKSEHVDDNETWLKSSGNMSHGRIYVLNSLVKSDEIRPTQASNGSSVGTGLPGRRRRMYSDEEIEELVTKKHQEAAEKMKDEFDTKLAAVLKAQAEDLKKTMFAAFKEHIRQEKDGVGSSSAAQTQEAREDSNNAINLGDE